MFPKAIETRPLPAASPPFESLPPLSFFISREISPAGPLQPEILSTVTKMAGSCSLKDSFAEAPAKIARQTIFAGTSLKTDSNRLISQPAATLPNPDRTPNAIAAISRMADTMTAAAATDRIPLVTSPEYSPSVKSAMPLNRCAFSKDAISGKSANSNSAHNNTVPNKICRFSLFISAPSLRAHKKMEHS